MSYIERPTSELGSDVGQTIRMPSNSLMTIDSRDRYQNATDRTTNPSTPYNFVITKAESLFNGFFTRIGLTEINFPWLVPNINYYSNSIQISTFANATPGTINTSVLTLSDGFLSEEQIAAGLQTLINANLTATYPAAGYSVVVQYSGTLGVPVSGGAVISNPMSFVITLTGAFTLSLSPDPNPAKASYNNLFRMMAWRLSPIVGGFAGTAYQVGSPTSATFTSYIDIVSRRLVAYQSLYDTTSASVNRNILCRLYLNTDNNQVPTQLYIPSATLGTGQVLTFRPPSVGTQPVTIYRQFRNPKLLKYLSDVPVGQLDFVVYDDRGNELTQVATQTFGPITAFDLPDYQMTFIASEN